MEAKIIQIQELSVSELSSIIRTSVREEISVLQQTASGTHENQEELLTRKQVLELLKISSVTLWKWQNSGRIYVYKFSNKCFYKKNELLSSLIKLEK